MHQLLSLKTKIWVVVGLAALVSAAARWFGLGTLSLGAVVGVVELMIVQLLLHSWRWLHRATILPLPAWMRMDLSGEWRGSIQSQWKEHPDDAAMAPIEATLHLRQSWQEIVFILETANMRSRSLGAVPAFDRLTGEIRFRYFYETEPSAAASAANPPQRMGSAVARISLEQPDRLTISYANERGARGDIVMERTGQAVSRRRGIRLSKTESRPRTATTA